MKKTLFATLLCWAGAAGAQQAVLWVPSSLSGSDAVIAELERNKALAITVSASELPKGLEERLRRLEKEGRLELALRPAGDAPLPLLYAAASPDVKWSGKPSTASLSSDQYFLGLRLGLDKEAAAKALGKAPSGLAATPGGLTADYFPLARALGVKWIACGPLASTAAAVLENGGVYAVPFTLYSSTSQAAPFVVFDETLPGGLASSREALLAELRAPAAPRRVTVSEALKTAVSTSPAAADISAAASPWSGDYSAWAGAPVQAGALAAMAQTRAALSLHLNSFQGDYRRARQAFDEYFAAEDGGKLAALASADAETASEAEVELRSALGNAWRVMQKAPPQWAFSSLSDAVSGDAQAEKLSVSLSAGSFEIKNVSRKPDVPANGPKLSAGADPYKVWKLAALRVQAGPDGTTFTFTPAAIDNSQKNPSGFSHIRLDLYMDINGRPRAGMTRPLEGRPLRLFPDSAWEYALEVTPSAATLYRITPKGPQPAGVFAPKAEGGAVTVRVPAAALRGNPMNWGYAALLLAPAEGGKFSLADHIADDVSNGYIYAVRPGKL